MQQTKATIVLIGQRPFNLSCLFEQDGTELKSRRPTEGARVIGRDKQILKQNPVPDNEQKDMLFFIIGRRFQEGEVLKLG